MPAGARCRSERDQDLAGGTGEYPSLHQQPDRPDQWPVAAGPNLTPRAALTLILLLSLGCGRGLAGSLLVALTLGVLDPNIAGQKG
jgi:hypothetical protein